MVIGPGNPLVSGDFSLVITFQADIDTGYLLSKTGPPSSDGDVPLVYGLFVSVRSKRLTFFYQVSGDSLAGATQSRSISVAIPDAAQRTRLMVTVEGSVARFFVNDDPALVKELAGPMAPDVAGTMTLGGFSPALQLLRYHGKVSHCRLYQQVLSSNPAPP